MIHLARNDYRTELSIELDEPVGGARIMLNLRAEADPEMPAKRVRESLAGMQAAHAGLDMKLDDLEHFRPGKPAPTHRDPIEA